MLLKPFDNRGPDDAAPAHSSDQNAAPGACSKDLERGAFKDAKNFVTMMASEPELGSVVKNSVKQVLASVLPGKS